MTCPKLKFRVVAIGLGGLLAGLPGGAFAQSSANFQLEQPTLNEGGHPFNGVVMSSASHTISLDSIGEPVRAVSMTSASFQLDPGFVAAYQPPTEVAPSCGTGGAPCLTVARPGPGSDAALTWPFEPSVGSYNVYRDLTVNLSGLGSGACVLTGLATETTTDSDPILENQGFFYLVTVVNRLEEQGTKGFRSNGAERTGTICP